jgi:hypothetical protein
MTSWYDGVLGASQLDCSLLNSFVCQKIEYIHICVFSSIPTKHLGLASDIILSLSLSIYIYICVCVCVCVCVRVTVIIYFLSYPSIDLFKNMQDLLKWLMIYIYIYMCVCVCVCDYNYIFSKLSFN